jgi:hypothetical protein
MANKVMELLRLPLASRRKPNDSIETEQESNGTRAYLALPGPVVLLGQSIKDDRLFDVLLGPVTELGVPSFPLRQPGRQG